MTFSPIIKKSFGPKREQTITTICSFARISGDCILIEASFEQMVIGEIVDLQQNAFQIISKNRLHIFSIDGYFLRKKWCTCSVNWCNSANRGYLCYIHVNKRLCLAVQQTM